MTTNITNVMCEKRVYSSKKNTHSHNHFQLLFPLKGSMKINTKEINTLLTPDHLFFLTPSSIHTFYSLERNEFLVLDIPKSMIPDKYKHTYPKDQQIPLNKKWESLRFLFLDEVLQHNETSNDKIQALFQYASEYLFPTNVVSASVQYINEHFNKNIDIRKLAEMENFHPTYYTEWFKNHFGIPPSKYIQQLRYKKAKELLKNTDYSILEVALEVGYNHASSLNRLFLYFDNQTPLEYRNKYKKQINIS